MDIRQIGPFMGDIIDTVLENRGVWNRDLFLNPDKSTDSDPEQLRNAQQGVELLFEHLVQKFSVIRILVDQDADGFTSSAILYDYLKRVSPLTDLGYILHETKAHGLTDYIMGQIPEDTTLLIIPDAGSNDVVQIEQLVDKGVDVLIIDHHHVTQFTDKGLIVNNQLCENTNNRLVGAGMVYKFLQLIDNQYGYGIVDDYLDLVAVGQIADASDISDNEIRNLVHLGLDNISNGFLRAAVGEQTLGLKLAPKDLSFGVNPIINSVTRVGTLEERDILFRALANIDTDKVFPTVKKKKNKETGKFENIEFPFTIYEYAYDTAQKCKGRQDSLVKKLVAYIDETLVDDSGIIIAFTDNIVENPWTITGLVANKIMSKYDKPALLLSEKDNCFVGSGRGHEKTLSDFRQWCENSELVVFAQGHDNAFGISIKKENIEAFKEYARKLEKKGIVYEVDLLTKKPDKDMCETIDRNKRLFGGAVSEPLIGIKGLSVPKRFIGNKGSVLNIYSWGVSITNFGTSEAFIEAINNYPGDNVIFDLVGTYGVNDWNGRKTPILVCKDIELIYNNTDEDITVENIVF